MKTILKSTIAVVFALSAMQLSAQEIKTVVYECNLNCAKCEAKVMKNIPYEKGVKDVSVNLEQKLVTVSYKSTKNTDVGLKEAITNLGYDVEIKGEPHTFGVRGNCGMCKTNIEKAAKSVSGVSTADWNKEKKQLTIVFDTSKTSLKQIHNAIAAVGYDTDLVKANDEAYNNLASCCKYDRD